MHIAEDSLKLDVLKHLVHNVTDHKFAMICEALSVELIVRFDPLDYKLDRRQFENFERKSHRLGVGAYGKVFRASHPRYGVQAALKKVDATEGFYREVRLTRKLQVHPRIVRFFGSDVAGRSSKKSEFDVGYLAFELMDGDGHMLAKRLRERYLHKSISLTDLESIIRQMMKSAIEGLIWMKSHNLCHLDMKPENILFKEVSPNKYIFKLTDFGSSLPMFHSNGTYVKHNKVVTTWPYRAPQQRFGSRSNYDCRLDLYSLGASMFDMLVGRYPWANISDSPETEMEDLEKAHTFRMLKIGDFERCTVCWEKVEMGRDTRDLIQRFMKYYPEKRISLEE
eukprot:65915_1